MDTRLQYAGILGILVSLGAMGASAAQAVPSDAYGTPKSAAATLSCPADAVINAKRCEGDICLTQAPGGVATDKVVIKGHVKSEQFTGLIAQAQNDRSKAVTLVNTSHALHPDGQFEVTVPLSQLGSYTIVIQVMRMGKVPLIMTARVSRVMAPHDLTASAVTISDPDKDHVAIAVDLEKSCREQSKNGLPRDCDLIGSQTGGTEIRAINTISSGRAITRSTNAGAEGVFNLCMPLGDGENRIEVQVCNPALPQACVILTSKVVTFSKAEPTVVWLDDNPEHLRFRIDHWTPTQSSTSTCDGEIQIEWNHEIGTKSLCPINGDYALPNKPSAGVNELGIHLPGEESGEFHYTFGWGHAVWAKDVAQSVQEMTIDHTVLDRQLPAILNRFLASDQFPKMIASLLSGGNGAKSDAAPPQELVDIRASIPACQSPSGGKSKTKVVGNVKVGSAHLDRVALSDNRLSMELSLEHLVVPIQIYKDDNNDGLPDKGILPLRIAFKSLKLNPVVEIQKNPSRILITTDSDDCTFKPASYCKHQPAIFRPNAMSGEATKGGAIVACDSSGQLGGPDMVQKCTDLDVVNMQTGQLSATIIDALNETLYCDVSARMTYAARHAQIPVSQDIDFWGRHWTWKMAATLDPNGMHVDGQGIRMSLGSQMEGSGYYYKEPQASTSTGVPTGHSLGIALREDLINQALATLVTMGNPGEGLLDWTFDEKSIAVLGFDFEKECVAGGETKKSALCNLRPNVGTLLGADLSNANYYSPKQALRVTIRGDRVLAPHLRFRKDDAGAMVVDLDIPNLQIGFAAIPDDPSKSDEPIITTTLTALIALTLDPIATNPDDPSQFLFRVRLRPQETRIVITPVAGSNHTLLPDPSLISQLRSELGIGLDDFIKSGKEIPPIKISKKLLLPATPLSATDESLLSRLGLVEIRFGDERLQWDINGFTHALLLSADPVMVQRLMTNGILDTYTYSQ